MSKRPFIYDVDITSKIRSSWIGKISTTILYQLRIICTMGFGNGNILPPLVSPNVLWMPKLCFTYINTTLPPKPNQHQLFHHNHTTTNITTKTPPQPILPPQPCHNHNTTTIIILQPTSPKPHCKQGPNVWSSIFLLCPLKDSGTFILALRPTTTTAAKTLSRYPPP